MLEFTTSDNDSLYWEVDQVPQSPKQKQAQIKEESLDNLVSTVKTAATQKKKTPKMAMKASPLVSMMAALPQVSRWMPQLLFLRIQPYPSSQSKSPRSNWRIDKY